MNKQFDLVVFDWDGTVMDSTGIIVTCIQQAARDLGYEAPRDEVASYVIGLGLNDALQQAVPSLPAADYPKLVQRYVAHWRTREHEMSLFDGMRELLDELKGRGLKLAVATGKSRAGLDRSMTHGGLDGTFDWTRCADETHSKPHPQMLHDLLDRFMVEPQRALMIGDTTHDSQMAVNAGVPALSVTYGAHPRSQLQTVNTLAIVDSVSALRHWLADHA